MWPFAAESTTVSTVGYDVTSRATLVLELDPAPPAITPQVARFLFAFFAVDALLFVVLQRLLPSTPWAARVKIREVGSFTVFSWHNAAD